MTGFSRAAVFAAGLAAAFTAALPVRAAAPAVNLSLRSFAASQAISSYEFSAGGIAGFGLQPAMSLPDNASALRLAAGFAGGTRSFADSAMLSPTLALDTGARLDIASRFTSYDGAASPFASAVNAPFLALANGGRYAGLTYAPTPSLRVRLGTALNSERLDSFTFDPVAANGNLPLAYDPSQTRSLLAGLSWDMTSWAGMDISGITSQRSGVPLGFADSDTISPRASTDALGVSAHMGLGNGWVTSAAYSAGLTQLDLRGGASSDVHEHSYSIAIAKRGLFGDDTLGLSFSQPVPGTVSTFSSLTTASGDLPPMVIGHGQALANAATPETDLQLGYVTTFLDGALALQANAAYQMNVQGQTGTNAVALLSRAKIKF